MGILLGSSAAIAAAFAGERLRVLAIEKTGLPGPVVALAEDAIVFLVGVRSLRDV
jgi:flavin-dependent dehydrogenase